MGNVEARSELRLGGDAGFDREKNAMKMRETTILTRRKRIDHETPEARKDLIGGPLRPIISATNP